MNREQLGQDLVRDEGCKEKPYQDSEGIWSWGIGRNLQEHG